MNTLSADTTADAERVLIRLWREMPAWRKLELGGAMNTTVRTLARAGLVQRFPEATPQVLDRRLADLLLGVELAAGVYVAAGHEEGAP